MDHLKGRRPEVGEPVEERRGHLGVAEDGEPFAEGQVGGDDHRGALVELAQECAQIDRISANLEPDMIAGLGGDEALRTRLYFAAPNIKILPSSLASEG
jgi:hypothetical protein